MSTDSATGTVASTGTSPADAERTDASRPPGAWRLRRRLGRAFTALGLLILVFAFAAVFSSIRFVLAGNKVIDELQPALNTSQQVYSDFLNEQGGIRSYLITGQRITLQPYYDFQKVRATDIKKLRALVPGETGIQAQIDDFVSAVDNWETRNAAPALARYQRGKPVVTTSQTRARTNRVRTTAIAVTSAIADQVAAGRSTRVGTGVTAAVSVGLGLLVLAIAGVAFWRGLHRWILSPVDRLGTQTRRVSSGELTRAIAGDGPDELIDLGADIEFMRSQIVMQLARAEQVSQELLQKGAELERSNADLQQFAYVASHDLSEPLRKVANFCQLLERQYSPQLDDRARQYIDFAVDGAKRMQVLITDLLALSRVGRNTAEFVPVSLDAALDHAVSTLAARMESTGARVQRPAQLPTVAGDRSLLTSLLENLVGNAVKYHRDDVSPVVSISVDPEPRDGMWHFIVRDNGIGIEAQYAERIFQVFQRLHLRDQFGGTGIGLALCRRIVDFHGGRIWLDTVESAPGSTFRFTLPEGAPDA